MPRPAARARPRRRAARCGWAPGRSRSRCSTPSIPRGRAPLPELAVGEDEREGAVVGVERGLRRVARVGPRDERTGDGGHHLHRPVAGGDAEGGGLRAVRLLGADQSMRTMISPRMGTTKCARCRRRPRDKAGLARARGSPSTAPSRGAPGPRSQPLSTKGMSCGATHRGARGRRRARGGVGVGADAGVAAAARRPEPMHPRSEGNKAKARVTLKRYARIPGRTRGAPPSRPERPDVVGTRAANRRRQPAGVTSSSSGREVAGRRTGGPQRGRASQQGMQMTVEPRRWMSYRPLSHIGRHPTPRTRRRSAASGRAGRSRRGAGRRR